MANLAHKFLLVGRLVASKVAHTEGGLAKNLSKEVGLRSLQFFVRDGKENSEKKHSNTKVGSVRTKVPGRRRREEFIDERVELDCLGK